MRSALTEINDPTIGSFIENGSANDDDIRDSSVVRGI
jgi:hypothetical protein